MKLTLAAAIFTALIAVAFAVYPQYRLRDARGSEFAGTFATYDLDETAYAAYLQALIDGRPRLNDPYTGRDDSARDPQPESLFSIQFVTAYAAAVPARVLGISAAQLMPILSGISAFATAIALFWMIFIVTGDRSAAAAGTVTVIVAGALISGIGALSGFDPNGVAYPYFPFLRRHIPSLSFPFLFAMFACVWNGLVETSRRKSMVWAAFAGGCFAVLLFSYFYLWTTAAAVMALLAVFATASSERRMDTIRFFAVLGGICAAAVVPYAMLLSRRSEILDKTQLLVRTHMPDLWRQIELIGLGIAAVYILLVLSKMIDKKREFTILVLSLSLAPLLVFNQQVITGRSLQPFHYEYYSMNYVAVLALVLFVSAIASRLRSLSSIGKSVFVSVWLIAAVGWGCVEAKMTSALWDDINAARDEAMLANKSLADMGRASGVDERTLVTLNFDSLQADSQPADTKLPVLWARHQHAFAGVASWEENRMRYRKLIYYSDFDAAWLKKALTDCSNIEACMALFGWDRFNPTLSANARPLTPVEIDEEVASYRAFCERFSLADASEPKLSYLIRRRDDTTKKEELGRWYLIGEPIRAGEFVIEKLTLR